MFGPSPCPSTTGFLPRIDPLRRLPQAELQPWEAMAVALPSLLAVGQARKPLEALPELSIGALLHTHLVDVMRHTVHDLQLQCSPASAVRPVAYM